MAEDQNNKKKIPRHPIQTIQVNMKMSVPSAADRRVLRER